MDIVRSGVYPSGVYPVLRDLNAAYLAQGPRLAGSDGRRSAGFLAGCAHVAVQGPGSTVEYFLDMPDHRASYRYAFTIERARLTLEIERTAEHPILAWDSSAWQIATDNRVTPTTVLGRLTRVGETGLVEADTLWHFPRHGCLHVKSTDDVMFRSDSLRPLDTNTFELKLAETATDLGDYVLRGGTHRATVTFTVGAPPSLQCRRRRPNPCGEWWTARRDGAVVPPRHIDHLQQRRIDALHDVVERRVCDRRATR